MRARKASHRKGAEDTEKADRICHKGHQEHEGRPQASVLKWKSPESVFVSSVLSFVALVVKD